MHTVYVVLIAIKKPCSFDHNEERATLYVHVNVAFIDNSNSESLSKIMEQVVVS